MLLESGERLPLLCRRDTGLPLFEPTLYVLTELRATGKASATIAQALRSVMMLCVALDAFGVDLEQRIEEGRLLELAEIEAVSRVCRLHLASITSESSAIERNLRKANLESARMQGNFCGVDRGMLVDPQTELIRLYYIQGYLRWRTTSELLRLGPQHPHYAALAESQRMLLQTLKGRVPARAGGNHTEAREGLSVEARRCLLCATNPNSLVNPWKSSHAKARNYLIVRWLHDLGLRRGELLGIRISDITFQANEVFIARRADAADDPRRQQPNTKTRARLLPLDEELAILTRHYIMGPRHEIHGARKHDYLFVANGSGVPMLLIAAEN